MRPATTVPAAKDTTAGSPFRTTGKLVKITPFTMNLINVLLVWLVDANRYLTCPPAATPSALMKDELVTHAVRCYAQANYGIFQACLLYTSPSPRDA